MSKLKKHRKKLLFLGLSLLLLGGTFALADYALKDGTVVKYQGKDPNGNPIFEVTYSDGRIQKNVSGYIDENGRGVPSKIADKANDIKEMGGYGSGSGAYNQFNITTPVYKNGEFVGYGNVYDMVGSDGKRYGHTYLSDGSYVGDVYGSAKPTYYGNGTEGKTVRVDVGSSQSNYATGYGSIDYSYYDGSPLDRQYYSGSSSSSSYGGSSNSSTYYPPSPPPPPVITTTTVEETIEAKSKVSYVLISSLEP